MEVELYFIPRSAIRTPCAYLSHFPRLVITLRRLRPKFEASGGFEPHDGHQIPYLYSKRLLSVFFLSCTENPRTPRAYMYTICDKNQLLKVNIGKVIAGQGHSRIYHTILKTAKSTFVPGFSILRESTVYFDHFDSSRSYQVLRIAEVDRGEAKSSI